MTTSTLISPARFVSSQLSGVSRYRTAVRMSRFVGGTLLTALVTVSDAQVIPRISGRVTIIPWPSESNGPESNEKDKSRPEAGVSAWVEELKSQFGLTRSGLAALLGVSRQTLYNWVSGNDIRENNVVHLQALRNAAALLFSAMPNGVLPSLWQHQRLPSLGLSFSQGVPAGHAPEAMARDLITLWKIGTNEKAIVDALFAKKGLAVSD